jgi:hypothetical protein
VGRRIRRHPGDVVRVAVGATIVITAAGAPTGPAVAGLLTYWLPILPGWLAYRFLRADGAI